MANPSDSSTIGDHLKWKRKSTKHLTDPIPNPNHLTDRIPSIIQSTRCKSTISSLLLSSFTSNPENPDTRNATKKGFKSSSLRGFGCTAQPEVSVPAVIRSSAMWGEERESKKKKKTKKKKQIQSGGIIREDSKSIGVQDLWCGPGTGSDATAASVDCVLSGLPRPLSGGRGKIDVNKLHHRERTSYCSRQRVNAENLGSSLEPDSGFEFPHFGVEERYYHHLRNRSPEGLAEMMMFQNGLLMGRRLGGVDRYRDWRLDVDNMTYEELLELGERIGYVNTGLGEDQIGRCLRKTKLSVLNEASVLSSQLNSSVDEVVPSCSICQEEYESEDEVGKLECGHAYHLTCIKQWLARKNACPVCKVEASTK